MWWLELPWSSVPLPSSFQCTPLSPNARETLVSSSLSAPQRVIFLNLILRESLVLGIFGLALGVTLTLVGRGLIETFVPTQRVLISASWILVSAGLVLG